MTVDVSELHAPRRQPQMFAAPRKKPSDADPAAEVGFFLARERENRALSLEAAAEATGIHPYHLDAIEMGDLTHMPPRMEAMEMIAAYANYLGFETEPLIAHLLSFLPPPPVVRGAHHPARPAALSSAKVLTFGKLPRIPSLNIRLADYPGGKNGVIASVAAVFLLFAGVHWVASGPSTMTAPAAEQVAVATPAPQPVAAPVTQPATPVQQVASAAAPSQDDSDALGALIKDQNVAAAPAKSSQQVASAAPAPVKSKKDQSRIKTEDNIATASTNPIPQPADGRVYGSENKDAHVVLKATAPVWLRIEDQQGIAVMTQMLNTGDTYMVPNRDGLVALTRDGGRLAYLIDGQEKGTLGPPGKILVNENLNVSALSAKH